MEGINNMGIDIKHNAMMSTSAIVILATVPQRRLLRHSVGDKNEQLVVQAH